LRRRWAFAAALALACALGPAAALAGPVAVHFSPGEGADTEIADTVAAALSARMVGSHDVQVHVGATLRVEADRRMPEGRACLESSECFRRLAAEVGYVIALRGTVWRDAGGWGVLAVRVGLDPLFDVEWEARKLAGLADLVDALGPMAAEAVLPPPALLEVDTQGAPGRLDVDGEVAGTTPLSRIEVRPGVRLVAWVTESGARLAQTVSCPRGRVCRVAFEPPPPGAPEGAVSAGSAAPVGAWAEPAGWATLGVGIAALAAGAGLGLYAAGEESDLDARCAGGVCLDSKSAYDARVQRGERAALAANILFGVGAAAAITGVVLLALDIEEPDVAVSPSVGAAGVALSGTF
jgi:hypothetical protein